MKISNCLVCKHISDEGIKCPAFPDGIPRERFRNLYDLSLEGKECANGVAFEEIEAIEPKENK